MKILITGAPKSGKSTVIFEHIANTTQPKRGMVTKELRQYGTRVGFDITTSEGQVIRLARTNTQGRFQVGKFFVNADFLKYSFVDLQKTKANELLYIDEIGQMQLLSDSFSTLVKKYFSSGNDVIASISSIFSNDLTVEILNREDVIVFQINESNRINVSRTLKIALENRKYYNNLVKRITLKAAKLANS
jgi:nucleoside-triphosphatase THEP1